MCTLTFNKQSKSSYLCNSELLGYSKEKKNQCADISVVGIHRVKEDIHNARYKYSSF